MKINRLKLKFEDRVEKLSNHAWKPLRFHQMETIVADWLFRDSSRVFKRFRHPKILVGFSCSILICVGVFEDGVTVYCEGGCIVLDEAAAEKKKMWRTSPTDGDVAV